MTDQMLYDRMCQMIRLGFVNARKPERMRVKVTLPDTPGGPLITDWLPVLCPRASGDLQFDVPDVGDQVLCLFLAYGLEQGFVIGSMYGRQNPPVTSGDKWHRTFKDGAKLEYDRASHTLTADIPGTANIKCASSITLEAPTVFIRGRLINTAQNGQPGNSVFSGGMEIKNGGLKASGDVVAAGVSLASHTTEGVQSGDGLSSHPTGGSAESPGPYTQDIPEAGSLAYDAWILHGLIDLQNKMKETSPPPTQVQDIIYCLPAIATSMASKSKLKRNKIGWEYLAAMFRRWLVGPSDIDPDKGGRPFEVSWQWLNEFVRCKEKIIQISKRDRLSSPNALNLLTQRLVHNDCFRSTRYYFDFIHPEPKYYLGELLPEWLQWPQLYFQSIKVDGQPWYEVFTEKEGVDGLQTSMASFMIYALAKGYTEPKKDGDHKIVIQEVALLAYDKFNFQDFDCYFYWSCKYKDFSLNPLEEIWGYRLLLNSDFRAFMDKYGYGNAFLVTSGPEPVGIGEEIVYNRSQCTL